MQRMRTSHIHVESLVAAIILTALIYGLAWLVMLELPELVWGVPMVILLPSIFYVPLYILFKKRWEE